MERRFYPNSGFLETQRKRGIPWTSGNTAEVDFIITHDNQPIPVEVKSDENIRSRSLTLYYQKYEPIARIRYSQKNLQLRDGLLNIPHFMVDYTQDLLREAISAH